MTKSRATHKGHCQVCNNIQKLPGGLLAAHGYTVMQRGWGGWFSGTCHGSHNLPFERDRALVDLSILKAHEEISSIGVRMESEKATPADPKKAWRNHSVKNGPYGYRIWVQVELVATHEQHPGSHPKYMHGGEWHPIRNTFHSLEDCAEQGKQMYLQNLNQRRAELRHFIERQQDRLKTWRPDAPLIPVAA